LRQALHLEKDLVRPVLFSEFDDLAVLPLIRIPIHSLFEHRTLLPRLVERDKKEMAATPAQKQSGGGLAATMFP
jgi:hypothetical protein